MGFDKRDKRVPGMHSLWSDNIWSVATALPHPSPPSLKLSAFAHPHPCVIGMNNRQSLEGHASMPQFLQALLGIPTRFKAWTCGHLDAQTHPPAKEARQALTPPRCPSYHCSWLTPPEIHVPTNTPAPLHLGMHEHSPVLRIHALTCEL